MGPMNGGPINLASARLRRASLRFATLSGANLESADLSGADLTDARLDGANLANADLSQAVLDHADFARARLAGANLCGANLSKARNLTEAQLAEGGGDASTLLPPHLSAPESWTSTTVEYVPQPVVVEETRTVTPIAPGPARARQAESRGSLAVRCRPLSPRQYYPYLSVSYPMRVDRLLSALRADPQRSRGCSCPCETIGQSSVFSRASTSSSSLLALT